MSTAVIEVRERRLAMVARRRLKAFRAALIRVVGTSTLAAALILAAIFSAPMYAVGLDPVQILAEAYFHDRADGGDYRLAVNDADVFGIQPAAPPLTDEELGVCRHALASELRGEP